MGIWVCLRVCVPAKLFCVLCLRLLWSHARWDYVEVHDGMALVMRGKNKYNLCAKVLRV